MSRFYTGRIQCGDDHVPSELDHCIPNVTGKYVVSSGHRGAVSLPNGLYSSVGTLPVSSGLAPQAVYNGGYTTAQNKNISIRIANGGAGQSGLIGALANAFIQHQVSQGEPPFLVAWYLGDTTESLGLLEAGSVDIAVTYNEAAEMQKMKSGAAVRREYAFRDHFLLVGPSPTINPAGLQEKDDVLAMFSKLVVTGNAHVTAPPENGIPTRFLSRYDKSATNIKESELFIAIGQVLWALAYSKWYHQYPRFPIQALNAAAVLDEYTLTDRGTWLSSSASVTNSLHIYKAGSDDASDPLLNPAHVLLGANIDPDYKNLCSKFMDWIKSADGGQKVVREFKHGGQVLYTEAPVERACR